MAEPDTTTISVRLSADDLRVLDELVELRRRQVAELHPALADKVTRSTAIRLAIEVDRDRLAPRPSPSVPS